MKPKTLLITGAAAAIAVLLAYIGADFFLGSIVTRGVNRFGPLITQTKVSLEGAHISPLNGSGTLSGLFVGNPAGWKSEKAFYFGRIHVEVEPRSLFGDHIIVKEIAIDRPEFVYETRVVSSNISELLQKISETAGSSRADPATAKGGNPLKFEVRHFHLTNGKLTLGIGPAALTLPMPPIELANLGTSEGGITSSQLSVALMRSILGSVVQATTEASGKIGKTLGAAAGQRLKELFGNKQQEPSNP
jgi:hypothetical protein